LPSSAIARSLVCTFPALVKRVPKERSL